MMTSAESHENLDKAEKLADLSADVFEKAYRDSSERIRGYDEILAKIDAQQARLMDLSERAKQLEQQAAQREQQAAQREQQANDLMKRYRLWQGKMGSLKKESPNYNSQKMALDQERQNLEEELNTLKRQSGNTGNT
jgi:chromosome segregation ATPase